MKQEEFGFDLLLCTAQSGNDWANLVMVLKKNSRLAFAPRPSARTGWAEVARTLSSPSPSWQRAGVRRGSPSRRSRRHPYAELVPHVDR